MSASPPQDQQKTLALHAFFNELTQVHRDLHAAFPMDPYIRRMGELLDLHESAQAAASWIGQRGLAHSLTAGAKREALRAAFRGFDFEQVAQFDERDVQRLLGDAGIVRHRGKIEAVISNARRAMELVAHEGSIAAFVWGYAPSVDDGAAPQSRSTSPAAQALSRELKRRGWRFVGPTTVYAFMQAMGLINDHVEDCVIRGEVAAARAQLAAIRGR